MLSVIDFHGLSIKFDLIDFIPEFVFWFFTCKYYVYYGNMCNFANSFNFTKS